MQIKQYHVLLKGIKMKKFEVNKAYQMRFIGDYELRPLVSIIKRTDKTVIFQERSEVKRAKIHTNGEEEFFYPYGKYSMAPIVRA